MYSYKSSVRTPQVFYRPSDFPNLKTMSGEELKNYVAKSFPSKGDVIKVASCSYGIHPENAFGSCVVAKDLIQ